MSNTYKPYRSTVTEQKEEREREDASKPFVIIYRTFSTTLVPWRYREEPLRKKNLQHPESSRKKERERGGKQAAYSRHPIEGPLTQKKKKKPSASQHHQKCSYFFKLLENIAPIGSFKSLQ